MHLIFRSGWHMLPDAQPAAPMLGRSLSKHDQDYNDTGT
jgi:hypothetical protein